VGSTRRLLKSSSWRALATLDAARHPLFTPRRILRGSFRRRLARRRPGSPRVKRREAGPLGFHALAPPTTEDVTEVVLRTAKRLQKVLAPHGRLLDDGTVDPSPRTEQLALSALVGVAVSGLGLAGERAGKPAPRRRSRQGSVRRRGSRFRRPSRSRFKFPRPLHRPPPWPRCRASSTPAVTSARRDRELENGLGASSKSSSMKRRSASAERSSR
jgi:hypothetical protein